MPSRVTGRLPRRTLIGAAASSFVTGGLGLRSNAVARAQTPTPDIDWATFDARRPGRHAHLRRGWRGDRDRHRGRDRPSHHVRRARPDERCAGHPGHALPGRFDDQVDELVAGRHARRRRGVGLGSAGAGGLARLSGSVRRVDAGVADPGLVRDGQRHRGTGVNGAPFRRSDRGRIAPLYRQSSG